MADQSKAEKLLIVTVPVANLRREPVEARGRNSHDDLQETQLKRLAGFMQKHGNSSKPSLRRAGRAIPAG
jgi:hypothetical protein